MYAALNANAADTKNISLPDRYRRLDLPLLTEGSFGCVLIATVQIIIGSPHFSGKLFDINILYGSEGKIMNKVDISDNTIFVENCRKNIMLHNMSQILTCV